MVFNVINCIFKLNYFFKNIKNNFINTINFYILKNFTKRSLFFILMFILGMFFIEYKLYIIQIKLNEIEQASKLKDVVKFFQNSIEIENPTNNVKFLNLKNMYLNDGVTFNVDLIFNVIKKENININNNWFIRTADYDNWIKFRNLNKNVIRNNFSFLSKTNYNEEFQNYEYLKIWRKMGPLILIVLLTSDFFLNRINI